MRPRQLVLLLALVPCWSFSPSARTPRRARVDRAASAEPAEVVALTREHGKNDELRALLEARLSLRTLELPCIAHESAADTARLPDVLRAVEAVAAAGAVPVVMSYWNPIERYGVERFATDLAAAGGAGAITPDLIPDEAAEWIAASDRAGLDRVFLVAPSSTDARLRSTTAACRGFVYAASTMGVTGTRATVGDAAEKLVARTREAAPDLAVCVGLGVSDGDQAAEVAAFADGVIVGSAYVRELLEGRGVDGVRALTEDLAAGVRRAGVRA